MKLVKPGAFASALSRLVVSALLTTMFVSSASAQHVISEAGLRGLYGAAFTGVGAVAPTITKSFSPSTVLLLGDSITTLTVTNPNAFTISNVQFSDTMPAGIDLITQVGGTCSTLTTGGGMFSINPGTETFSSTSTVLTAGQSCTIIVRVQGTAIGQFVNTTSSVTATGFPPGGPASATLTVGAVPEPVSTPTVGPWQLAFIAVLLALFGGNALRHRARA